MVAASYLVKEDNWYITASIRSCIDVLDIKVKMSLKTISKDSEIIIVGSGVFGLSSALHLKERGYKNVTIYDRLDLFSKNYDAENGADTASADINKVLRVQYGSKTHYHKLALRAKEIFEKWDREILDLDASEKLRFQRLKIVDNCGLLRLDNTPENTLDEIKNLATFEASGLRHTQFDINDADDVERAKKQGWGNKLDPLKFRERKIFKHLSGVLDSTSGLIQASNACVYVQLKLRKLGVKFVTGEREGKVKEIIYGSDNTCQGIITEDGKAHVADLTIVAAGPWTGSILPEVENLSQAASGNVVLIKIPENRPDLREKYSVENFPMINWRSGEYREKEKFSGFGLFPSSEPQGIIKIITRQVKYSNPITIGDSKVSVPLTINSNPPEYRLTKAIIDQVRDFIRIFVPDLAELGIYKTQLLWYTNTVNNDFIIDYLPGKKNLLVVTGGSGHGFKFLPVLGESVVDKLEGKESELVERFKWRNPDDYEDINELKFKNRPEKIYYNQTLMTENDLQFTKNDLEKDIEID